jgi:dipeptidyl aminopeptidase/acylaminoacyl peptidase
MKKAILPVLLVLLALPLAAQTRRPLKVEDIFALKDVGDPRISPDGRWIAFTVFQLDEKKDESDTNIWMVPAAGGEAVQLTFTDKPETRPRWSPDGKYLAFMSGREGEKGQVWLLDRRGGEARKLTDVKQGVSSFAWSPDSSRLALVIHDPDPDEEEKEQAGEKEKGKEKAPKPIVVRRLQFKRDEVGFLNDLRDHLYVFDVNSRSLTQVTSGPYDDSDPAWSPDGKWIAFASNRSPEPDSNFNTDIFLVPAAGGDIRAVANSSATEESPLFTHDGSSIVYNVGGDPKDIWYGTQKIAVVPVDGGQPRVLTAGLDRNAFAIRVSRDGSHVVFVLEDRGTEQLARVPLSGGEVERLVTGDRSITQFDVGPAGEIAVLESTLDRPAEISMVKAGGLLERLTKVNDAFLSGIELGKTERFKARSADGTMIDAFLTRPPSAPGGKLPAILRIHGGPVAQFSTSFELEWQLLAAHGYAVVAANPRGSSGRGRDFSHAIWADWGNKDYQDVMAAVDTVVEMGVADPDRLGVGGWSYGGILTDHVIVQTTRFKAAISGASEVNYVANYGHDHYQREWEAELGLPFDHPDLWMKLSPFFRVRNVKTPTLIMNGQEDWNVPLLNSEQLYQALRRLGVATELVVYPGQGHGIRRPSYQKDRYQRYIAWYDKYVKGTAQPAPTPAGSSRR